MAEPLDSLVEPVGARAARESGVFVPEDHLQETEPGEKEPDAKSA